MLFLQLPVCEAQSVTLTWNPSAATNIAGYKIYSGTTSHSYTNTVVVGNATNATLSGLAAGETNYFAAVTYDSAGNESAYSSEVAYFVPAPLPPGLNPVTGLTVTANPGVANSVILSWTASADAGVTGYQIMGGTASGDYSIFKNVGLVNSLVFTGLVTGATYYFVVREFNAAWNESPMSAQVSWLNPVSAATLTVPAAPTLTAPVHSGGQFSFTVSGVAGSQYVVQASTDLVNWVAVQTNTAPFTFVDTNAASFKNRFYRTCSVSP